MNFDFSVIFDNWTLFARGTWLTIVIAIVAIATGFLISIPIALAFFASSYFAEIIRGAILAVPKGQMEAARAIGMSYFQGLYEIVAPQTVRLLLPPSTNTSISMVKETSVLSTITVAELTYQGLVIQGETFAPFEIFLTTAAIYWMITAIFAYLMHRTEKAFGASQGAHHARSSQADKYLLIGERRPA